MILSITSVLISINWTGFILAISLNRVQDASMGYYMTPIISIILGYLFLKESMSKLKLFSIILMLFSIIFLIASSKTIPYLALIIGISWGFYGMLRKQISITSEIGLLYESGFITLISSPHLIYLYLMGGGYFINENNSISLLLIFTGLITIFPLFFFNLGVKFIPLGFAGVIFFLAPTFHFITSILILNEDLSINKLISFLIIWLAVIIFIVDLLKEEKKVNENNIQLLS